MLRCVALIRTDVSEERFASIIRVKRIELGETVAVTSNWITLQESMLQLLVTANIIPNLSILITLIMDVIHSSEMLVLTRVMRRKIADDGILHHPTCYWITQGKVLIIQQTDYI
jgi:hypothetical protein